MSVFDLRLPFMAAINVLKSSVALDHSWDPFGVISNPTWTKFGLLVVLLFLFSFVSVKISPDSPFFVWVKARNFSAIFFISFVALVIVPQPVFWYFYPIILLSSSECVSAIFWRFALSLQAVLPTAPGVNIRIEPDLEMGQQSEGANSDQQNDGESDVEEEGTGEFQWYAA